MDLYLKEKEVRGQKQKEKVSKITLIDGTDITKLIQSDKITNFEGRLLITYEETIIIETKEKIEDVVNVKIGTCDLGIFRVVSKNNYEYQLTKENKEEALKQLFDKFKYGRYDFEEAFQSYKNGLLKLYIDFLLDIAKNHRQDKMKGKFTAMISYRAVKKFFSVEDGFHISEANVFIKDVNVEFDALLLKRGVPINQGVYDEKDVVAIIEIKASGYIGYKDTYVKDFEEYVNFSYKSKNKEEIVSLEERRILEKKLYIYFSLFASGCKNKESLNSYKECRRILKENNKIGIFALIKHDSNKLSIPYEYDIDIIKDTIRKRIGE